MNFSHILKFEYLGCDTTSEKKAMPVGQLKEVVGVERTLPPLEESKAEGAEEELDEQRSPSYNGISHR
jgi:hypothetical protein